MKYFYTAVLMTLSFSVSAEVYQWKDNQGRWHYGDKGSAPERATPAEVRQPASIYSAPRHVDIAPLPPNKSQVSEHPQLRERRLIKERCDKLRAQAKRKGEARRAQQDKYDRECVLASKW